MGFTPSEDIFSEQNVADDLEGYSLEDSEGDLFEEESVFENEDEDFDFSDDSDDQ